MTTRKMTKMLRYQRSIVKLRGNELINPFKSLRDESNYTLDDLSRMIGITKQAIIRTEQGTYIEVPPRIIEWYSLHSKDNNNSSYLDLTRSYRSYQTAMRKRHDHLFGKLLSHIVETSPLNTATGLTAHPFTQLKRNWINPETLNSKGEGKPFAGELNTTEVAKLLCIPQGTLDYWENKVNHQASVPNVLLLALRENGYSSKDIGQFCKAYTIYRDNLLGYSPVGKTFMEHFDSLDKEEILDKEEEVAV